MADVKITDYAELAAPISTDMIEVVSDPGGTPISKKAQIRNLFKGGGQIAFPATAVPSSDANTLDDYEEGEWTGGISFGGGTTGITYQTQACSYTKVGHRVFVNGYIRFTSKGTDNGTADITGLPFTVLNSDKAYSTVSLRLNNINFADFPQARFTLNDTVLSLKETTNAGVESSLDDANFADGSLLMFCGHYIIT